MRLRMASGPTPTMGGVPRPHKRHPNPTPHDVTVRRIGSSEPVEVIAPDELARRKDEAEWQRFRQSHGLDLTNEHERLAVRFGDPITVASYTGELWWFVRDVDGVDRTITAGTLIFDQPRERTFPFELVEPLRVWGVQRNEIAMWQARVQSRLGPVGKKASNSERAAS